MKMDSGLGAVALGNGQTPQDFALASKRAAKGAKSDLSQSPANCASGNCNNRKSRKKYKTKDEAAKAALKDINGKSIADNKEYAGQIYQNPDGTYGYTAPVAGSGDASHPSDSPVPAGTDVVGNYHTHGDYSVTTDQGLQRASELPGAVDNQSDNFSQGDFDQYAQLGQRYPGFTGYLGTPGGMMRSYDTTTEKDTLLGPLQ